MVVCGVGVVCGVVTVWVVAVRGAVVELILDNVLFTEKLGTVFTGVVLFVVLVVLDWLAVDVVDVEPTNLSTSFNIYYRLLLFVLLLFPLFLFTVDDDVDDDVVVVVDVDDVVITGTFTVDVDELVILAAWINVFICS